MSALEFPSNGSEPTTERKRSLIPQASTCSTAMGSAFMVAIESVAPAALILSTASLMPS